jgi:methyltransferase
MSSIEAEQRAHMEQLIRKYFVACNAADRIGIESCFVREAIHYFPPGMYGGPFKGAAAIAERWCRAVADLGSRWAIDNILCDPATQQAVIEWSHYKAKQGVLLRGDEWYIFDAQTGLIREIRAYYASPQDRSLTRMELEGFSYSDRGYSTEW